MQFVYSLRLTNICGSLVFVISILFGPCVMGKEIPSIKELTTAYNVKYHAIKTIRIDTVNVNLTLLVDQDDLLAFYGVKPYIPGSVIQIQNQDGRFYGETRSRWSLIDKAILRSIKSLYPGKGLRDIPFDELKNIIVEELAKVSEESMPADILVYDGKHVWQHREATQLITNGVARNVYVILNPDSSPTGMVSNALLEKLLISFPVPSLPKDNAVRLENRLPDMLASGAYAISPILEEVSGHSCVLVKSMSQSIWLDPKLGFAVRRRVWRHRDGKPVYEIVANQFEEILPEILWLPRTVLSRQYGITEMAEGRYAGVPIHESVIEITNIEVNLPEHEMYFSLDVPPGNWVTDMVTTPLDSNGKEVALSRDKNTIPSISYLQPADQADLDQVIQEARLKKPQRANKEMLTSKKSSWFGPLIWFNIGFLTIFMLYWCYRKIVSHN